jgi:hypothetical protein
MELANSGFGSELSNNNYSNLTAVALGGGTKPKPKIIGTPKPVTLTTTSVISGSVPTSSTSYAPRPAVVVASPIIDMGLPIVPVYSAPPSTSPTPSGGSGGGAGGGSGSETGSETGEEKSAEATEEKAPETTTSKAVVEEVSFFKKPIGKVTALILLVALAYGGYRVMKSKGIIK